MLYRWFWMSMICFSTIFITVFALLTHLYWNHASFFWWAKHLYQRCFQLIFWKFSDIFSYFSERTLVFAWLHSFIIKNPALNLYCFSRIFQIRLYTSGTAVAHNILLFYLLHFPKNLFWSFLFRYTLLSEKSNSSD